ncbi:MAG: glutathione transferase GstA [Candidatus Binatus sp.]|uniref:glutathione transferase GstA n=1 Tax=Candidatus Binatus sp. TaxID=2811406 RepID=UPI00271AAEE2|nr:glutathione transferase GstA [Candidatus Binatus sp.]MDO8432795.1 glutathione transferase GstA [Candidatus Binatus sp.]
MKLYFSPGACSLSPHIVLQEAGINAELEAVDLKTKKTKSGADFTAINPKGQVPTLVLDSGEVLTEGPAIVQYLADRKPETKLVPAAGTIERYKVQEWLNFISSELHKGFAPLFNPATPDDYKKIAIEGIGRQFALVDAQLGKLGPFLTGAQFTVADAYLFVMTTWTKFVGIDLAKWPRVKAYSERIAARPKVQAALKEEGLA